MSEFSVEGLGSTLRSNPELLRTVFESVTQPLYVVDAQTYRVVMANSAARLEVGVDKTCYALTHSRDTPCDGHHVCPLAEVKRTRKPVSVQHVHKDLLGNERIVEIHAYPLLGSDGEVEQMIEFCLDVTERHRAEQRRRELEAEVQQAQKMEIVGRLAGGVAHDFNNILSVIVGYSALVLGAMPPEDPNRHYLDLVLSAGERAANLTRRLLTFSRRKPFQTKVLDMNSLIQGYGKMLLRMLGNDVQLTLRLDPHLGRVCADTIHIEQVLANLAVNARHAMPSGGDLSIVTSNHSSGAGSPPVPELEPGEFVCVTVSDTGVGMSPEILEQIFEPFFTTKPADQGTGLGLSTSRDLVHLSGGMMFVESIEGQGTTFRVYLPRVDEEASSDWVEEDFSTAVGGTETILVLEDDDDVRVVTRRVLEGSGYRVLEAANAGEGLLLSEKHDGRIHLLLSDVQLPLLNGPEFARRLRPDRPDMRSLFVSGDPGRHDTSSLDPPPRILLKPFQPRELLREVRAILDAKIG